MQQHLVLCLASVLSLSLVAGRASADEAAEKSAVAVADAWLKLVDEGQYDKSYDQAAELLKKAIKKDKFAEATKVARDSFGKLLSRKVLSKKYAEQLPGAPDGKYVVIQYEARYEKKKSAIETVTPMLEKDGQWRVSGYYIR